jgi:hypothetical protein
MCLKSVIVKTRKMRRPRPPRGCRAIGKKIYNKIHCIYIPGPTLQEFSSDSDDCNLFSKYIDSISVTPLIAV